MPTPKNSCAISIERSDQKVVIQGRLDVQNTAKIWSELLQAAKEGWIIDASKVSYCDSSGAALFYELKKQNASIESLPSDAQNLLKPYADVDFPNFEKTEEKKESAPMSLGRLTVSIVRDLRDQLIFTGQVSIALLRGFMNPRLVRWSDMWHTVETAGANALLIVGMIGFLTGMIMAFQSTVPLRQFGVDIFVVNLVALAMLRELGGIMTAIVLAGRSGSAFAAEIGTMKVNEEVNALITMGLDPVRFLAVPKLIAAIIVTPLLTIYANVIGIFGGLMVVRLFGHPWAAIYNQLTSSLDLSDIATGMIKSFFFGALVGGIGCLRGLQTKSGASAVGDSTTRAVVSGIFLIIMVDAIFAVVFYAIGF